MGSLGEEDLEKLVLDYIESSPITVSDHLETSPTVLITLEVSFHQMHFSLLFS